MDRLQGNDSEVLDQAEINRIISENSVDEFPKLRGAPGYCLETMPWNQIVELISENTTQSLGTLGRHPSGVVTYRRFRQQVYFEGVVLLNRKVVQTQRAGTSPFSAAGTS